MYADAPVTQPDSAERLIDGGSWFRSVVRRQSPERIKAANPAARGSGVSVPTHGAGIVTGRLEASDHNITKRPDFAVRRDLGGTGSELGNWRCWSRPQPDFAEQLKAHVAGSSPSQELGDRPE